MQPIIETEPIVETRGDDWQWPLTLVGDDDAPFDLAGCGFDGAAILWRGGALPLSIANGRLAVEAGAGRVTVAIARGDTLAVPDGQRARAVLPITDAAGRRSTLIVIPLRVIVP